MSKNNIYHDIWDSALGKWALASETNQEEPKLSMTTKTVVALGLLGLSTNLMASGIEQDSGTHFTDGQTHAISKSLGGLQFSNNRTIAWLLSGLGTNAKADGTLKSDTFVEGEFTAIRARNGSIIEIEPDDFTSKNRKNTVIFHVDGSGSYVKNLNKGTQIYLFGVTNDAFNGLNGDTGYSAFANGGTFFRISGGSYGFSEKNDSALFLEDVRVTINDLSSKNLGVDTTALSNFTFLDVSNDTGVHGATNFNIGAEIVGTTQAEFAKQPKIDLSGLESTIYKIGKNVDFYNSGKITASLSEGASVFSLDHGDTLTRIHNVGTIETVGNGSVFRTTSQSIGTQIINSGELNLRDSTAFSLAGNADIKNKGAITLSGKNSVVFDIAKEAKGIFIENSGKITLDENSTAYRVAVDSRNIRIKNNSALSLKESTGFDLTGYILAQNYGEVLADGTNSSVFLLNEKTSGAIIGNEGNIKLVNGSTGFKIDQNTNNSRIDNRGFIDVIHGKAFTIAGKSIAVDNFGKINAESTTSTIFHMQTGAEDIRILNKGEINLKQNSVGFRVDKDTIDSKITNHGKLNLSQSTGMDIAGRVDVENFGEVGASGGKAIVFLANENVAGSLIANKGGMTLEDGATGFKAEEGAVTTRLSNQGKLDIKDSVGFDLSGQVIADNFGEIIAEGNLAKAFISRANDDDDIIINNEEKLILRNGAKGFEVLSNIGAAVTYINNHGALDINDAIGFNLMGKSIVTSNAAIKAIGVDSIVFHANNSIKDSTIYNRDNGIITLQKGAIGFKSDKTTELLHFINNASLVGQGGAIGFDLDGYYNIAENHGKIDILGVDTTAFRTDKNITSGQIHNFGDMNILHGIGFDLAGNIDVYNAGSSMLVFGDEAIGFKISNTPYARVVNLSKLNIRDGIGLSLSGLSETHNYGDIEISGSTGKGFVLNGAEGSLINNLGNITLTDNSTAFKSDSNTVTTRIVNRGDLSIEDQNFGGTGFDLAGYVIADNFGNLQLNGLNSIGFQTDGNSFETAINNHGKLSITDGIGMWIAGRSNVSNYGDILVNGNTALGFYADGSKGSLIYNDGNIQVTKGAAAFKSTYDTVTTRISNRGNISIVDGVIGGNSSHGFSLSGDTVVDNFGDIDIDGINAIGFETEKDSLQTVINNEGKLSITDGVGMRIAGRSDVSSRGEVFINNKNALGFHASMSNGSRIFNEGNINIIKGTGFQSEADTLATLIDNRGDIFVSKDGSAFRLDGDVTVYNFGNITTTDNNSIAVAITNGTFINRGGVIDAENSKAFIKDSYGVVTISNEDYGIIRGNLELGAGINDVNVTNNSMIDGDIILDSGFDGYSKVVVQDKSAINNVVANTLTSNRLEVIIDDSTFKSLKASNGTYGTLVMNDAIHLIEDNASNIDGFTSIRLDGQSVLTTKQKINFNHNHPLGIGQLKGLHVSQESIFNVKDLAEDYIFFHKLSGDGQVNMTLADRQNNIRFMGDNALFAGDFNVRGGTLDISKSVNFLKNANLTITDNGYMNYTYNQSSGIELPNLTLAGKGTVNFVTASNNLTLVNPLHTNELTVKGGRIMLDRGALDLDGLSAPIIKGSEEDFKVGNFFDTRDDIWETALITTDNLKEGVGAKLDLIDHQENALDNGDYSVAQEIIQNGKDRATVEYGISGIVVRDKDAGNLADKGGIYLGHGLKSIYSHYDSMITIDNHNTISNNTALRVKLKGLGGYNFVVDASKEMVVGHTESNYYGDTSVQGGMLIFANDNAFGNSANLTIKEDALVDLAGHDQFIRGTTSIDIGGVLDTGHGNLFTDKIMSAEFSTVNLDKGSLNLRKGGVIEGLLYGRKGGAGSGLNMFGGELTITHNNRSFSADTFIAKGATINFGVVDALGSSSILHEGQLNLRNLENDHVNNLFSNNLAGKGAVNLLTNNKIVINGDNRRFDGKFVIEDGTLEFTSPGSMGTADIIFLDSTLLGATSPEVTLNGANVLGPEYHDLAVEFSGGNGKVNLISGAYANLVGDNSQFTGQIFIDNASKLKMTDIGLTTHAKINNDGVVKFNLNQNFAYENLISGKGSFAKLGSGNLTLTETQKYQGWTDIQGGRVVLAAKKGLETTSRVDVRTGASLFLNEGSFLGSQANRTHLNTEVRSALYAVNGSTLYGDINHSGKLYIGSQANPMTRATQFGTFTIDGNYVGNGGTVVFGGNLGDKTSLTDKLTITGDASGYSLVQVNNIGGVGAMLPSPIEGIKLIDVGGTSVAGAFTRDPNNRIIAGAFEYELQQGVDGSWYLTSYLMDGSNPTTPTLPGLPTWPYPWGPNGPGANEYPSGFWNEWIGWSGVGGWNTWNDSGLVGSNTRTFRPEVGSYLASLHSANRVFAHSVHDRNYTPEYQGVWTRIHGNFGTFKSGDARQNKTSFDDYAIQLGVDFVNVNLNGTVPFKFGGVLGYGHTSNKTTNSLTGNRSKGRGDGYSIGLYTTFGNTMGWYADGSLQYVHFKNKVRENHNFLNEESYNAKGLVASIEGGYTFKINENLYLQPQAQVTWMGVKADDHREWNGTIVKGSKDNIQSRVGAKLYGEFGTANTNMRPFAEINYINNSKETYVDLNGTRINAEGARNIGQVKVGIDAKIGNSTKVWGDVSHDMGKNSYKNTKVSIGIKYSF